MTVGSTMSGAARNRSRRGGQTGGSSRPRLSVEQKHAMSFTCTRYVPPMRPSPRQNTPRIRVVRQYEGMPDASSHMWTPYPADLFTGAMSGFDTCYIHRIACWTRNLAQSTGKANMPSLNITYCRPGNGAFASPEYVNVAGAYNENARVGFHVPNNIAGPWQKADQFKYISIQVEDIVTDVTLEVDATYC